MIKEKKLTKLYYLIVSLIIIISLGHWFYKLYQGHKAWLNEYKHSSFKGVIRDTQIIEGYHGWPTYFFTNDSSHQSDINEEYMQSIAKIGDSLSKFSGNDTIYIFRKKDSGEYIQIYPYHK